MGTRARQFGTIRKLPSGRWQARYVGPDTARHSAPHTFTTKAAAAAWLAGVQTDIERGEWKSPEQIAAEEAEAARAAAAAITVRELAERWIATVPSQSFRHLAASRIRRFINPPLGDVPVAELTREQCDRWYADLPADAPTQRRGTYAVLAAILGYAVDRDLITTRPLRIKGALADTVAREPQTATAAEVDDLAAAMPPARAMAVQLAAWCGLRAGEVLGLQRGDVAVDPHTPAPQAPTVRLMLRRHMVRDHGGGGGGDVVVSGTKAADKVESVTVPPHLVPALWEHLRDHAAAGAGAWLFTAPRDRARPLMLTTLRRSWVKARTQTGLTHLTFHDLRRTGTTLAAIAGATPGELKQRLRHKTSAAAERYIVAARGADAELAAKMSAMLRR